jgi:SAM-dependent methyltransferase
MAKNRALAAKTVGLVSSALTAEVSPQYKQALADLVLLFSSYRELLDSQEASIESLSTQGARELAEAEVLAAAITELRAQYDVYRRRCNELTLGLPGPAKQVYRQYTQAVLHPFVLPAPLPYHCYHKPLGYPGDYVLMSYLYDAQLHGKSLYEKLIHQVVVRDEPMAIAVRKRKDFLLAQIRGMVTMRSRASEEPCRILSLGSGPAQEIVEFVSENRDTGRPVAFTLIDQDQRALAHANSRLARLLVPGVTKSTAKYLYIGFKQLIVQPHALDSIPEQDLIYAAGLFDYIRTPTAQRLVQRLFRKLNRRGKLLIGNFKRPNDAIWCLEYWMDWHLIYRDQDEMRVLADRIPEVPSLELESDASGYTHMLTISRC